jgi:hypothetical protein
MELSSMYEKATLADLAIVTGILLALCSFILAPFRSMDFFLIIGVGIGLVAVGFILDRIYERRRAMVDLERMRPKLAATSRHTPPSNLPSRWRRTCRTSTGRT